MTTWASFDIVLAVLVLPLAFWTIAARQTFVAVVSFVAYGLLLALVWGRLGAPDVAPALAAIGSGPSRGALPRPPAPPRDRRAQAAAVGPRWLLRVIAAVLSVTVAAALAVALQFLPDPAPTLAPAAARNLAATGVGNPVTAVLMAFRAMDTLLEKVVLMLALVGVWSLA